MPWTTTFLQDTEAPGLGTVTATYTDDDGNTFTHSRQVKTGDATDRRRFAGECKAALDAKSKDDARRKSVTEKITADILAELNK